MYHPVQSQRPQPLIEAAGLVLSHVGLPVSPRVLAVNYEFLSEEEARSVLERLEAHGYVERVDDGLFRPVP